MSNTIDLTEQGHLTLAFQMKSPADAAAAKEKIDTLLPEISRGAEATGIIHYCRLVEFKDHIYFIADYDGEQEAALEAVAKHLASVLDALLIHTSEAPPTPVADNTQAFLLWAAEHHVEDFADYLGHPGATVQQIKSLAANAGITLDPATATQLPLLLFMELKGTLSLVVVKTIFKLLNRLIIKGADGIGTLHFAHLMELPNNVMGMFTAYDGPFDKYAQDFATHMGPAFDLIFKFANDPSPSPTAKNVVPFTKWVNDRDAKPLSFYAAYPGLTVQDVRALLADASAS